MQASTAVSSGPLRLVPIAPAVSSTKPEAHDGGDDQDLMPFTCTTCARRKVKCDKAKPCSACKKGRLECIYSAPPPRKRKRKTTEDAQERADRYERILKDNNLLPKDEASPADDDVIEPAPAGEDRPADGPPGTLRERDGRTRYIDSSIWKILGDDLHPSSDEEEEDENDAGRSALNDGESVDPVSSLFYGPASSRSSLLDIHPTYDAALKLWNLFVTNVDPILKIVHVPSGLLLVQRSAANPSSITRTTECLLFAIYHFAVYSATEQECRDILGASRAQARRRFHDATRKALVNCHFLRTTELAILQAYILFLLSVRATYDPHTFWILTGIAVRIGQRIGIHRYAAEKHLNPFDAQMRRRIFWQLLPLDGQAAQLDGTGLAIPTDTWDTQQPLNIDDEDMWPGMDHPPVERQGATDIIFCLARSEMGRMLKKVRSNHGNWTHTWDQMDCVKLGALLDELEELVESKYVRYCDVSVPVQFITIAMCRTGLNSMRMRVLLPRNKAKSTREERMALWKLSNKILDSDINVRTNQNLRRFFWHLESLFFQWDPIIWILSELRQPEPVMSIETAWSKITQTFDCRPEVQAQRRAIDIALARLTIKVWDQTHARGDTVLAEPAFLSQLRASFQRRELSRQSNCSTPQLTISSFSPPGPNQTIPSGIPNMPMAIPTWMSAIDHGAPAPGAMNFNFPTDFTTDLDADWLFWDQISNDPQAYLPLQS